jgi:hypothetical protein
MMERNGLLHIICLEQGKDSTTKANNCCSLLACVCGVTICNNLKKQGLCDEYIILVVHLKKICI